MDSPSFRPSEWQRPSEERSGPKLLLGAALLAAVGVLVGIFAVPGEHAREEAQSLEVPGVSRLVYPARLVQETEQPVGGEWMMPAGVTVADSATFVLDTGDDRILKLDEAGRILATLDGAADQRLALQQPMAIASDGHRLFVANSLAAEVLIVDPAGRVEKILSLQPAAAGEKAPRPIGVAVTPDGGIVVSDADNHRVLRLDNEGRVLWSAGTGTRAAGSEGFNVPGSLAVDDAGNIYVVDVLNGRVVKLSPDGAFIRQFGRRGNTAGTLSRPKGVAVDAAGRVFVSDGLLAAVEVFAPDGTYLGVIGRRDPADPASGSLFQAPAGLSLAGDRLYVIDRFAGLITLELSGGPLPEGESAAGEGD